MTETIIENRQHLELDHNVRILYAIESGSRAWDLRKALGLFAKSNPPLLEWLGSPIIYRDEFGLAGQLRELLASNFLQQRCMYHYLHMARGKFRDYLNLKMLTRVWTEA